jgi:two-component system OmpR family response regulator
LRILIAEDDAELRDSLVRRLASAGHEPVAVADGHAAGEMIGRGFDVAVLDRMLPGSDGLTVLSDARAAGIGTPILVLTALGQIADRVEGLSAGADDYLVKPFAFEELVARLHALARRASDPSVGWLRAGGLSIDLMHREVRFRERLIPLQPREVRLLEALVRNVDTIVTRAMLLETVWGFHFDPQTNLVETHISRLRSKLSLGGLPDAIETVRGSGYRFRGTAAQ